VDGPEQLAIRRLAAGPGEGGARLPRATERRSCAVVDDRHRLPAVPAAETAPERAAVGVGDDRAFGVGHDDVLAEEFRVAGDAVLQAVPTAAVLTVAQGQQAGQVGPAGLLAGIDVSLELGARRLPGV